MNVFLLRALNGLRKVRESGMTMIEIVVALALLGVVTTFTTATVLNTTTTSDNFNKTVQNEGNLLDAVSLVTRDVSLASSFKYAGSDALSMVTTDSGTASQVYYFVWTKNTNSIPATTVFDTVRANSSKLPTTSGLVEYRVVNGNTSNPVVRNLIPNYNPGGNTLNSMFTYYDTTANEILLDAVNPPRVSDNRLDAIRRVEMHFTSYIDSRTNAMEMHTSAVPRLMGVTTSSESERVNFSNNLPAPQVNGNLSPRTNTADLWWGAVAGADDYDIYYMQDNGSWTFLENLQGRSGTISYQHSNLDWGSDYIYKVIANDHRGPSPDSNSLTMRVTPEPTQFDRIESTRGLNGEAWANYTVARNLQNSLYWTKVTGPKTEYKIRASKNAAAWTTIATDLTAQTTIESGKNYGDVTSYTVTAYNDVVVVNNPDGSSFATGGEAVPSPTVPLTSPPIRPEISVSAYNDLVPKGAATFSKPENHVTVTNIALMKTEKNITFYTATSNSSATLNNPEKEAANTSLFVDNFTKHTNYSANQGWGTTNYYFAQASNDAGNSPVSVNTAKADQHPGPFSITDLSNPEGYANFFSQSTRLDTSNTLKKIGNMSGTWSKSLGNGGYTMNRSAASGYSTGALSGANDPGTGKYVNFFAGDTMTSNETSFSVKGVSPGIVYNVSLQSKASANNLTRTINSSLLTRPDVAQSGYLEAMCLANGNTESQGQTFGMFVRANTIPRHGVADKVEIGFKSSMSSNVPATRTVDLSTDTFAWQQSSGLYDNRTITLTNIISPARIPDSAAKFGTTTSERRSQTPYMDHTMLSGFGVPCSFDYAFSGHTPGEGNAVVEAGRTDGYNWVVHQFICYGFVPGRAYGDFWVIDNQEYKKGYTNAQKTAYGSANWKRKKDFINSNGCIWRLDPMGAEPYWESVVK